MREGIWHRTSSRLVAGLVAAAVLSGCGGAGPSAQSTPGSGVLVGSRPPTQGPQPYPHLGDRVHFNLINGLLNASPVFNGDFADPFPLHQGAFTYVYASNTTHAHVPVLEAGRSSRSPSVYLGDALPTLPPWTAPNMQWAPSVWQRPDGTYVMYYSTPDSAPSRTCIDAARRGHVSDGLCYLAWGGSTRQCISAATAVSPVGPFTDRSAAPFVCPRNLGGAIDPSVFMTSAGTPYLLWKSDGDGHHLPTVIYSQRLSGDGLATAGGAHRLIGASQRWEGNLVEGPSMIEYRGTFWLFYSANNWDTPNYAIGVARCDSVTGPCHKVLSHPWLSAASAGQGYDQGPGGEEFANLGGLVWMVHHGWLPGQAGTPDGQRRLYVDLIYFPHGRPALAPRTLSAALADLEFAAGDPTVPAAPEAAFETLVKAFDGHLTNLAASQLIAFGRSVCADLSTNRPLTAIVAALQRSGLSSFEAEVLAGFAAQHLCPRFGTGAFRQLMAELEPPTGRR